MIEFTFSYTFPAAFALLPGVMDTPQARAMLLATGLQESEFRARHQGGGGPARGFWQFEKNGGVKEILTSASTIKHIEHVCSELCYSLDVGVVYTAIEHNDPLACCLARLLLWKQPSLLPERTQSEKAWLMYLHGWRPGKPRPDDWSKNYAQAWGLVSP